jgi:hypothetical protein
MAHPVRLTAAERRARPTTPTVDGSAAIPSESENALS